MSFAPIALTIPQYDKSKLKLHWLKAFEQGTVTPLVMATDATGATTASRFQLDSEGFPITAGSVRFIPFINGQYDLWLFPTAAEADANDTTNAIQFADNLNADPSASVAITSDKVSYDQGDTGSVSTTVEKRLQTARKFTDFLTDAQRADVLSGSPVIDLSIPLRTALDAGPVIVPNGTYLLTRFEHKSGDVFVGESMTGVIFKVTTGVIFAYGVIDAASFTSGNVTFSTAGTAAAAGNSDITMDTATDANKYSVGEIVAIWSAEGYTDGLSTFKPLFQQFVSVKAVNGTTGVVSLDDQIYKTYSGTGFRVSKGSEVINAEGVTNGFTRDIIAGNFSVDTPDDSWTRFGGTYESHLFNIRTINTHGIFVNNGFAKSRMDNVGGTFSKRAVDLAYFSHNSEINLAACSSSNTTDGLTVIIFAEGSHHNHIRNQSISCPVNSGGDVNIAISYGPGSDGNKLTGGWIQAPNCTALVKSNNQESGVSPMLQDNNILDDIEIRTTSAGILVDSKGLTTDVLAGLIIGDGVTLHADACTTNTILMDCSGIVLRGCKLSAPTLPDVLVRSGVSRGEIRGVYFTSVPTSFTINDASSVLIEDNRYGDDSLMRAKVNSATGAASSNTDPAVTLFSRTFPIGTLLDDDVIELEGWFEVVGTTSGKNFAWRINGTNVANQAVAAGTVGGVHLKGSFSITALTAQRAYLHMTDAAQSVVTRGTTGINVGTTALTVELAMWVNNAADNITPETVKMKPFRDK